MPLHSRNQFSRDTNRAWRRHADRHRHHYEPCVYATCRDATDSFRVIVAREAVGERCEIMHAVNRLDIDLDLGDVTALDEVIHFIEGLTPTPDRSA